MTSKSFTNSAGIALPLAVIETIRQHRDYLSELDGAAGDGDHGINMAKGMNRALARIEEADSANLTTGFAAISDVLLSEIGGSMGPLYGGFFRGVSVASRTLDHIDGPAFGLLIEEGVKRIRRVSEAQVGDKTLIDVLSPATIAYDQALLDDSGFDGALNAMEAAAAKGLESTKGMVAKIGRSSRLGERSRGHLDAGAASCTLILTAMGGAAKQLLENGQN